MELTNIPENHQCEIVGQIANSHLTVKQIREIKSQLEETNIPPNRSQGSNKLTRSVCVIKVTKKTSLALKVMLARLDNLIDEVHETIEPSQRGEIINFLMETRLKVHSMIDDAIRFRNANLKRLKE